MVSGAWVLRKKKCLLSLPVSAFLMVWAIVPIKADARVQQRIDIANDGTVYQFFCSDGQPLGTDHDRVTNVSMAINFNASASVSAFVSSGTTLDARVPANPLVDKSVAGLPDAKRSGDLSLVGCPPSVTFSSTGSGTWASGGNTFSGFGSAGLTAINSAAPAASVTTSVDCGDSVYGFGGTATCATPDNAAQPSDGISLLQNHGILFVYAGANFVPTNTAGTLNVAGGVAGFDTNGSNQTTDATGDSDTLSISITTTTVPTTTTHTVPTVGNWGMTVLVLAFLGGIAWMLKARKIHAS